VDTVVDLRVDDHPEPIRELRRLLGIHQRWHALRRASRFYRSKEWSKGIEVLTQALAKHPDDATILYDLACYESLAGRLDDAMRHLARSLALEPGHVPMAQRDGDLDPLRGARTSARPWVHPRPTERGSCRMRLFCRVGGTVRPNGAARRAVRPGPPGPRLGHPTSSSGVAS
jgi:hypothetical protein